MQYKYWLKEWLECYVKPTSKRKTYVRYSEIVSGHIIGALGNYEMAELTPLVLQRFITELLHNGNIKTGKGLSANSVNGIITVIQNSLKEAYAIGHIAEYTADKIKRQKVREKQVMCFTPIEQKLIEQAVLSGKKTKMFGVVLCLYTGLRIGELLALEWKDIDFCNGIISLTKTCYDGKDESDKYTRKSVLNGVPSSGEFVRWLQQKKMPFDTVQLIGTKEVGTILAFESTLQNNICRPFNLITEIGGKIVKKGITEQGAKLAIDEMNWYNEMMSRGYKRIPRIYSFDPLTMEKVDGINIFKAQLSEAEKKIVLKNFVDSLLELHSMACCDVDYYALKENYYVKTFDRINKVRDMIPFADGREIIVNGISVKNVFFYKEKVKSLIENTLYDTKFTLIHGDCTFSNTLIDKELQIKFIDPRGYFGKVKLFGDEYYDWAKLYYSAIGNYDQFNNKHFTLDILENEVKLTIESNRFEHLEEYLFSLIPNCDINKIKLLHAIIWLSLSTYAWEDYDSICGAFYNGLLLMDEFLN